VHIYGRWIIVRLWELDGWVSPMSNEIETKYNFDKWFITHQQIHEKKSSISLLFCAARVWPCTFLYQTLNIKYGNDFPRSDIIIYKYEKFPVM
jgi:hypothetical protein